MLKWPLAPTSQWVNSPRAPISPFFLYPASSPSPNNLFSQTSTCSKPSPSHLTIQSMSTLQRCFFKNPFWKSENLASHRKPGPAWSFSFWPSCWLRSANTTLPAFAKVANIHFFSICISSHMWEEFAILATIKPADQQVGHSLWFDHQVRSTAVQLGL